MSFSGAPVAAGAFGAWTPIGSEAVDGGYEVVWQIAGADQYAIWNVDSGGHYRWNAAEVVSGSSYAVEAREALFHQDLNGNGTVGLITTTIESLGATKLVQGADTYFLMPVGDTSGPQLKFGGAGVTVGAFGAWTPIGAEAVDGGYEVVWQIAGADQYAIWNVDSGGNYRWNAAEVVSGSSYAVEVREAVFQQDLNGDGTTGLVTTTIAANGSTHLTQVADTYFLYAGSGTSGPQLKFGGAGVTVGAFGAWTPIGAEAVDGGYEVVWQIAGADQYAIWSVDSGGHYRWNAAEVVSGSSYAVEVREAVFQQDLNGDGTTGLVTTTIAANGATRLSQVADTYFLYAGR